MNFETIEFSVSSNVAHLVLNRPDIGNAVNMTMAEKLLRAARICLDDEQIGAARRLLLQSMNAGLQEQLDREAESVSALMDTAVFKK